MFSKARFLPVMGLGVMLVASGCSAVEGTITGDGADTTQTAPIDPTTTAEPEPTTTTAQGYVSEGNGLSADELRQMLEAVEKSGGEAIDIQAFGFRFPVEAPEGGELWGFQISISEGSDPGEAQRSARIDHRYSLEALPGGKIEEFYEDVATELDEKGERGTATIEGSVPKITFNVDDSIAGEQLEITNASEADQLGAAFIFMNLSTPSGNPNVVGDPGVYSSWFDGVVPIPIAGEFVGGGAAWGNADRELRKGSTLFAEFEFSGRKQLELEDEIAELAESSGFSVTEGDSDIVLENDEVVATYTFDAEDDLLQVEANFKTSL